MKKVPMAMVAVAAVALAGSAMAAPPFDTTVSVNATVTGNCRFLSGGSVAFTLDPASDSDADGTVTQPTFWCTKGTPYTIVDDNGENESGSKHQMKHVSLNEFIPYDFTYTDSGSGGGRGTTITMDIASKVTNADFINASKGDYADIVKLTINP